MISVPSSVLTTFLSNRRVATEGHPYKTCKYWVIFVGVALRGHPTVEGFIGGGYGHTNQRHPLQHSQSRQTPGIHRDRRSNATFSRPFRGGPDGVDVDSTRSCDTRDVESVVWRDADRSSYLHRCSHDFVVRGLGGVFDTRAPRDESRPVDCAQIRMTPHALSS